jgi:hypothetical protein
MIGPWIMITIGWLLIWFGYRNTWVYRQRVCLSVDDYVRLESYSTMMWKFWIWDVREFIREE